MWEPRYRVTRREGLRRRLARYPVEVRKAMRMRQWISALWLGAAVCSAVAPVLAASPIESAHSVKGADGAGEHPNHPRVLGNFEPRSRYLLRKAFGVARYRSRSADCQSLFHDLGSNLDAALSHAVYMEPRYSSEEASCWRRQAVAFTTVGPGVTVICPTFRTLSVNEAAAILLHEALHNAGQTEWPSDPEAPTSRQIQDRVQRRCRL